jgi:hypothetical protein
MHWGVRKDDGGVHRLQASSVQIEPGIHSGTQEAAREVSSLIASRYGFEIKNVKAIKPGNPEYPDTLAYVEDNKTSKGRNQGTIFVQGKDLTARTKHLEDIGWLGPGTGNIKAIMTHESAHSLFHADQTIGVGLLGPKLKGGNIKARDKALKVAYKAAKKEGKTLWDTSGYAATAGVREELEGELFSQYHWSPNPPNYVKVWGQTLHQEMGVDPTPFKEVK